ncbi:MAG TPA: M20/M25/M40 family metallo-hydrolase [Bacillus sp. (in: firmicutes)]|uniref:M20/M25/M40 family metallo-hydrolase n=1 Tax=Bacillus litorisediminis TaxID=2922713 RepID=UPI001FB02AC5|nr:M20/M25/M40 family metallo-hydrolase [Bacillus litorisediminis]HWO78350.1 M20/M25/M40 family metallo-hydrolase [Bacillus sp. (in: firmicutes)]
MYEQLKQLSTYDQIELMTKTLVSYPSYSGTEGEAYKANVIKEIIYSFPYFMENPELVWEQPISDDLFQRKNIFVLLPSPNKTKETIILHAHIDTVHTYDYGSIQSIAHQPDALLRYFQQEHVSEEIKKEANSGEWMFGRGTLDMQSGIAVHLANLLYYSEHTDELAGNLLFIFNVDEEAEHTGIKAAVGELYRLKEEQGLEYVVAINDDFIAPLYQGDQTKYLYVGNAGKILPSFYIQGRESHVGEAVTAIDPTLISSELVSRIGYQLDLIENLEGELVNPPSVLLQRDRKDFYNVQTPLAAMLYFNYFIYEKSVKDIMDELIKITEEVSDDIISRLKSTYKTYCQQKGMPEKEVDWQIKVQTYNEFIGELEGKGVDTSEIIDSFFSRNLERDSRLTAFNLINELVAHDPGTNPRIILFLAAPYLPNHTLQETEENGRRIRSAIEQAAKEISEKTGEQFAIKRFFPFLSDGNFLSFKGSQQDIDAVVRNFPAQDKLFPMPLTEMEKLQIPSINLCVYGKDGHRWTERVYKPYSFGTLPLLIRSVIQNIFS